MRATRILVAIAVTAVLAGGAVACGDDDGGDGAAADTAAPATERVVVELAPQNGSGLSGTAQLAEAGADRTRVTIAIDGDAGPAHPSHVHRGTCADLDPAPAYGLRDVADGASETVIDAPLATLRDGTFAINLHRSAGDLETYVACGDIG
ncbi:hypothetical protein [Miltoncostaea marina]|uniref:hypothetical protein n=1 Tax=Miltoncostaea marina TaxID=2843215 RepID=UPI001C3C20D4|nr:hypothetical protein [Miltoncostaea marina]